MSATPGVFGATSRENVVGRRDEERRDEIEEREKRDRRDDDEADQRALEDRFHHRPPFVVPALPGKNTIGGSCCSTSILNLPHR